MEKFTEKEISSREVFKGRLLRVRVDTVKLPSGIESTREVVEHPGAVAVIALTADNELVLVRQFRTAIGEIVLEVPAGVPLKGEKGEDAARRELEEETGYHARSVQKVWEGYASPGYSNELIQFFLAREMDMVQQRPDEDEFVEAVLVDVESCLALVKTGQIRDVKTLVGVMVADRYLKGELN